MPKDRTSETGIKIEKEDRPLNREEWYSVGALGFLCTLNIMFWGIYEQQGNTLQLWADEKTNWNFFGLFNIPTTWFQSFNPIMIFIFVPIIVKLWDKRALKGKTSSSVSKMGFGCILAGLAYIVMILAAKVVPDGQKGSVFWLMTTVFIFTMGEIYLSPIGLSLVTKVAPKRIVSMMMGVWFLSSFIGNYMTGYLGTFYSVMKPDHFFMMLTFIGLITGALFYATRRPLEKIIGKNV